MKKIMNKMKGVLYLANIEELRQYRHIHMIGIGGVSMSGIAEILKNWGFIVTGSDRCDSPTIQRLRNNRIHVAIGHDLTTLSRADAVVYTAAIPDDDIELVKAREYKIPTIERSVFLGKLTKAFSDSICVSGTHGKTTTTSMIALCFLEAQMDPSIQVGAYLKNIDGNYRVGNSNFFIIEACEYVESFLKLFPKTEVILNIDNDHLDYFKNLDNIKTAFEKYVALLPENGVLVMNFDDKNCLSIKRKPGIKLISYGVENQNANFVARNIKFDKNGCALFDVYHNNNFYKTIKLSVPGKHNILNALACIGVCHAYGLEKEDIKNGLQKFTGANRRFEYKGSFRHIKVYDDYGHHPTEIEATAKAMKNKIYNESWVVFQPHTYSRTKNHLKDFAKALLNFDHIIITDIYAARETNTYGVSAEDLVKEIKSLNRNAIYISDFEKIVTYIKSHALNNDLVLTLGAGTVTEIGPMLVKEGE